MSPTEFQKLVLITIADLNHWSFSHYATDYGIKKLLERQINPKNSFIRKKWRKKGLYPLISAGLVIKHPTENDTTYQLTREGLEEAEKIVKLIKLQNF